MKLNVEQYKKRRVRFTFRTSEKIMKKLYNQAKEKNISVNELINLKLDGM